MTIDTIFLCFAIDREGTKRGERPCASADLAALIQGDEAPPQVSSHTSRAKLNGIPKEVSSTQPDPVVTGVPAREQASGQTYVNPFDL